MIQTEILIIGNEVLSGRTKEKNAAWLLSQASTFNLNVKSVRIIGDNPHDIHQNLSELWPRAQLLILSGGLGRTKDDLTQATLENFLKTPLEFLPNPLGTALAPFYLDHNLKKMVVALPGVPREFQAIMHENVAALIKQFFPPSSLFKEVVIRTYKIGESLIFQTLCPNLWDELSKIGTVSSLPHTNSVDIVVKIEAKEENLLAKKEQQIREIIQRSKLLPYVWQWEATSLEETLLNLLKEKKKKLAFAESCTGGLNSHRITNIAGSSQCFMGTIVSYDNQIKKDLLEVSQEILDKFGAVSDECAKAMAQGARKNLAADIAVATTGIAGPGGGSEQKPVGTVWIAISTEAKTISEKFELKGNRELLKERFSQMALFMLWETLHTDK